MKDIQEFLLSTASQSNAAATAARESIISQLLRHPNLIPIGPLFSDQEKMPWFVRFYFVALISTYT